LSSVLAIRYNEGRGDATKTVAAAGGPTRWEGAGRAPDRGTSRRDRSGRRPRPGEGHEQTGAFGGGEEGGQGPVGDGKGQETVTAQARQKRTRLDRVAGMDVRNFRTSRRLLRETGVYELPERVMDVYTFLRDSTQRASTPRTTDDDVVFAVLFLLRSAYAFEKGLVEVMRVYLSDSMGYLRMAIESAGFVDVVRRDQKLARTWLDAGGNEARYALYRKKFGTKRMFPEADPLMRQLYVMYDWASRMASHGSLYAFSMRLVVAQEGTARQFKFGYQDVKDPKETWRDVLTMFMVHINNQLRVLQVFGRALKDVIEKATWDLYFNTAEGLFDHYRDRLAPILNPKRPRVGGLVVPVPLIVPARPAIWTPGGSLPRGRR